MPKFYDIKAAGENSTVINIFGDIGFDWWAEESNDAKAFSEEVGAITSDFLTVRINSYGGSVSDGLAIFNAITRHNAKVTTEIVGVAYSIASLIAMAGDEVVMAENTLLMIHAPWGHIAGNAVELREHADVLDKYADAMATSYMNKSGQAKEQIDALLKDGKDHYFTAAEALAEGFIDSISDAVKIAASALKKGRYSPPASWIADNQKKVKNVKKSKKEVKAETEELELVTVTDDLAAVVVVAETETTLAPEASAPVQAKAGDVIALCKKAGFESLAIGFIESNASLEEANAVLARAGDVRDICAAVGIESQTVTVLANKPIDMLREALNLQSALLEEKISNNASPETLANESGTLTSVVSIYAKRKQA